MINGRRRWIVRSLQAIAALLSAMVLSLLAACVASEHSTPPEVGELLLVDPDVTIGLVEGDSAYLFGNVVSVALDEQGRIYVGDRIGATVRVYDSSGQYVKRIAREGQGPGEIYGWPADVTSGPRGRIYVRDGSRITVFAPAVLGEVADSVAEIWSLPGRGNLLSTRSRVSEAGEYYYPRYLFRDGEPPRFFYLPFRDGSPTGDTLEVPAYPGLAALRTASYRTGPRGGRLLPGLSHVPFAPLPVWDVTPAGTILSSSGSEYALLETNVNGDTLRVMTGPTSRAVEISASERADSARALGARLDTLPVPFDEVVDLGAGVRERRLPTILPPLIGVHVAADGSIWVERWPAESQAQSRFFDVLDSDGRLRTRIVLRAPLVRDPPPFFAAQYVVGVIRDSDTGVERIVRFTLAGQPAAPIVR